MSGDGAVDRGLAVLQLQQIPEAPQRQLRPRLAEALLGAAVRVAQQEVETGGHLDERRLVETRSLRRRDPGRAGSGSSGSFDGDAGGERRERRSTHPLAVVADRQPHLEGVAGAVGGALGADADDDLLRASLPSAS